MTISERYRQMVEDARQLLRSFPPANDEAGPGREVRLVSQAVAGLAELEELVGEIPRMKLESQVTPVLLKAHGDLDRSRLLLEETGAEDRAAAVWELEQQIYRLLNDL